MSAVAAHTRQGQRVTRTCCHACTAVQRPYLVQVRLFTVQLEHLQRLELASAHLHPHMLLVELTVGQQLHRVQRSAPRRTMHTGALGLTGGDAAATAVGAFAGAETSAVDSLAAVRLAVGCACCAALELGTATSPGSPPVSSRCRWPHIDMVLASAGLTAAACTSHGNDEAHTRQSTRGTGNSVAAH